MSWSTECRSEGCSLLLSVVKEAPVSAQASSAGAYANSAAEKVRVAVIKLGSGLYGAKMGSSQRYSLICILRYPARGCEKLHVVITSPQIYSGMIVWQARACQQLPWRRLLQRRKSFFDSGEWALQNDKPAVGEASR